MAVTILITLMATIAGCNTVSPFDTTGAGIFREGAPNNARPEERNSDSLRPQLPPPPAASSGSSSQSCPPCSDSGASAPSVQSKQKTSWLGSSRDPNSTVSKQSVPLLSSSREISELTLGPCDPVARTGTQVIMVAGVKDKSGKYRTNQQVEWTIDRTSPGGFVDIDRRTWCDIMAGEWVEPKIESPHRAYSSTSRKTIRLSRGAPTSADDTVIREGQTWIAIASPCEGTTKLTALAADSSDWRNRIKVANIHWIDAWAVLPPSGIAQPIGQPLNLLTRVHRQDGSAARGCVVTYEIIQPVDDAGFDVTDGRVKNMTVPVDEQGVVSIPLYRNENLPGQTRIRTTVVRDTSDGKFTVPIRIAQTESVVTWGSSGIQVTQSGPMLAAQGEETAYRITVRNTDKTPSGQITLTSAYPESFEYLRSMPVGRVLDALTQTGAQQEALQKMQWIITGLRSGESQNFDVVFRPRRAGDFVLTSAAQSGSARAEDSIRTRIMPGNNSELSLPSPPDPNARRNVSANIDIRLICPDRASTGETINLRVEIKNNGAMTLAQTQSFVAYSSGLRCSFGSSPVRIQPIGFIQPNQTKDFVLPLKAISSGRQTCNVEIITEDGQRYNRQVIITVDGDKCLPSDASNSPVPDSPSPTPSSSSAPINANGGILPHNIGLQIQAPNQIPVNTPYEIFIIIKNLSKEPISQIQLDCKLDSNLRILQFTQGLLQYQNQAYWNIPVLQPQSETRYYLKVSGSGVMPTQSRFTVIRNNLDLAQQLCQTNITVQNSGVDSAAPTPTPVVSPDSMPPSEPETTPNGAADTDSALPNTLSETPAVPENADSALDLSENVQTPLDVSEPEAPAEEGLSLPDSTDLPVFEETPAPESPSGQNENFRIDLSTRRTELKNNQSFTLQIELTNTASNTMNSAVTSLFIPPDMFNLIRLGTTGPTNYKYESGGGVVTFDPVPTLEPGQSQTYKIRLMPIKTGAAELSATVFADKQGIESVRQSQSLTVEVK